MWPAQVRNHGNAYVSLLAHHLVQAGTAVIPYQRGQWRRLTARPMALHIHWPENKAGLNTAGLWAPLCGFLHLALVVLFCRLYRIPITWTVHNLSTHEQAHCHLEPLFWRIWNRLPAGTMHLSRSSQVVLRARWPHLAGRSALVCAHGLYDEVLNPSASREEIRARLYPHQQVYLLLCFGAIRPYKRIDDLILACRASRDPNLRLIVIGQARDQTLAAHLQDLAAHDSRIRLELRSYSNADIADLLLAADCAVLPQDTGLNSGAVYMALSLGCPCLVPACLAMREAALSAPDLVRCYRGRLTADLVNTMLAESPPHGRPSFPASWSWSAIARCHQRLFRLCR